MCDRHPKIHGTTPYGTVPSFSGRDVPRGALVVRILALTHESTPCVDLARA